MLRDRATRSLTYNDEQFHALEKIKIGETGKRIKALLQEDVRPVVAQIAECLADWYKRAQTVYLKTQILEKDALACDDALFALREQICHVKEDFKSDDISAAKNQTQIPIESTFFTRDMQNNIRVSILLVKSYDFDIHFLTFIMNFLSDDGTL